jgi:hypothetical protein
VTELPQVASAADMAGPPGAARSERVASTESVPPPGAAAEPRLARHAAAPAEQAPKDLVAAEGRSGAIGDRVVQDQVALALAVAAGQRWLHPNDGADEAPQRHSDGGAIDRSGRLRRMRIGWHTMSGGVLTQLSHSPTVDFAPTDAGVPSPSGWRTSVVLWARRRAFVAPAVGGVVLVAVVLATLSTLDRGGAPASTESPSVAPVAEPAQVPDPAPSGEPSESAMAASPEAPVTPPAKSAGSSSVPPAASPSAPAPIVAPPVTSKPPDAGQKQMDIATNYAWARGSIAWNGTTATATGQVHDTVQYDSHSWLRIAYKLLVDGVWKQQYVQPDPYVNVANGAFGTVTWSLGGPVKDVQWDLCSSRTGPPYCTGWT